MEEKIKQFLDEADLKGFTRLLKGDCIHRYVVAFTHNEQWTTKSLASQSKFFGAFFDNLTLGGRTDSPSNDVIVDIGTSTDNFLLAWAFKTHYNQIAIYDSWLKIEIF